MQNEKGPLIIGRAGELDLEKTLLGGQAFRWRKENGCFCGTVFGISIELFEDNGSLYTRGDGSEKALARWRSYLDLDTDYEAIKNELLEAEPKLEHCAERCGRVHILNQDGWEALCSFIVSQNNNIPRIKGIIERLCALCGLPAENGGFAFPSAELVASLSVKELAALGCGYRAEYIKSTAEKVASGEFELERLRVLPVERAREMLLTLNGVGPKVADCTLLFGFHRLDCFPRDVWIKRALEGEFKDTALESSRYAGVAQQYIFEYIREKGE